MGSERQRERNMYLGKRIRWEAGTRPHARRNYKKLLIGGTVLELRPVVDRDGSEVCAASLTFFPP